MLSNWRPIALAVILLASVSQAQESRETNGLTGTALAMAKHLESFPEPNRGQWKLYFGWEQWGEPLSRQQLPDQEIVRAILPRFYGFFDGLDDPTFLRMRTELKSYVEEETPQPRLAFTLLCSSASIEA